MDKQPIISLCIPTNGMVRWIIPTVKSIYDQGVDNSLFEVVVTDNGSDDQLAEAIKQFNYPNLRYYKTQEKGFVNQIASFKQSTGIFIKMLNHRSCLRLGVLAEMIDIIRSKSKDKPILYFADGNASGCNIIECQNTDEFVRDMSYWVSWSAGVGLWDIDKPMLDKVRPNQMFPHMCLMFDIRQESKYVIWNKKFQDMQDESGKGGYDVFYTFSVTFVNILNDLFQNKRITNRTFVNTKKELLYRLADLYYLEIVTKSSRTFIIKNVRESITTSYSILSYYKLLFIAYCLKPISHLKLVKALEKNKIIPR